MTGRQLSERIGNMDERLIEQAEHVRNYGREKARRAIRRTASIAAALVLMVAGGFGLGATVFAQEVEVEIPVVVEPESVTLEDFDITLILPESWEGRYAVEKNESGNYVVYSPELRERFSNGGDFGGVLFYVNFYEEQATQSEVEDTDGPWNYAPHRYIMTTRSGTYVLYYPTDMQAHPDDYAEYEQMENEISQIRFVVDNALGG